jgi:predicted Rossmann fold nucleotide-binding protein DprA/Smf involved in DNA uptake
VILSGLARGIDTIAHEAALGFSLPTIAILGCGINVSYPPENDTLQLEILKSDGLIVSELLPDEAPRPSYFIERNRLIAGWARATWVVEAGFRSGALNTASWARKHDRTCFATPCYPGDVHLAGNQVLLDRDGAIPLWNAESLLFSWLELGSFLATHRKKKRPRPTVVMNDAALLTREVERASAAEGGIPVADLRAWSHRENWETDRFVRALREASEQGKVANWNGILTCRIH